MSGIVAHPFLPTASGSFDGLIELKTRIHRPLILSRRHDSCINGSVMMNEFVSLFVPLVYAFLLSACAFLLLALVLTVRKRSKNGAVPIPVGVTGKSAMIPKPNTEAFRWWTKYPESIPFLVEIV